MEQICRTAAAAAGVETRKKGAFWWEVTQKRRGDTTMPQNAAADLGFSRVLE
jgi:hypothetical protein